MKNKKGQVQTTQAVLIAIGTIAVISIALALILSNLSQIETLTPLSTSSTIVNQSINVLVNATGGGNSTTNASLREISLTSVIVVNATSGQVVTAPNYSIAGGRITALGTNTTNLYLDRPVNITYTYTYRPTSRSENVQDNLTTGIANDFFASIGSVFSILIAAVVITIIVLIFIGIRRFSDQGI